MDRDQRSKVILLYMSDLFHLLPLYNLVHVINRSRFLITCWKTDVFFSLCPDSLWAPGALHRRTLSDVLLWEIGRADLYRSQLRVLLWKHLNLVLGSGLEVWVGGIGALYSLELSMFLLNVLLLPLSKRTPLIIDNYGPFFFHPSSTYLKKCL